MKTRRISDPYPPLSPAFCARDPRQVGPDLLGKLLVRRDGRRLRIARIVEVEAYLGQGDLAAHAAAGRTDRNAVLFGPPGRAYVYFIYGNHYCLNVSCMPQGDAGSVLIRALEPLGGIAEMAKARGLPAAITLAQKKLLTSGPGRLCEAFGITRVRDNDRDLLDPASGLWLADVGFGPPRTAVTPRIGISKHTDRKLRYLVAGNPFVSGPRKHLVTTVQE